jgi:hypothetical protein
MDVKKIGFEDMDWICLVQKILFTGVLLNRAMDIWIKI